jgi:transcriptional regulator with XRE-family HTH domain
MNEAELFGQLLRATRKSRKMSLADLAEKVDKSAKYLGRLERGESQASFDLIIALANAMSVSPSAFFDFESVQADQKLVKEQLRQLLQRQDGRQLLKAYRVLKFVLGA